MLVKTPNLLFFHLISLPTPARKGFLYKNGEPGRGRMWHNFIQQTSGDMLDIVSACACLCDFLSHMGDDNMQMRSKVPKCEINRRQEKLAWVQFFFDNVCAEVKLTI